MKDYLSATRSFSLDVDILYELEALAKAENSSVSKVVNDIFGEILLPIKAKIGRKMAKISVLREELRGLGIDSELKTWSLGDLTPLTSKNEAPK